MSFGTFGAKWEDFRGISAKTPSLSRDGLVRRRRQGLQVKEHTLALTDRAARNYGDHGETRELVFVKNMGFEALWITPVVPSMCLGSSGHEEDGYHGYWARDLYESETGSARDLRNSESSYYTPRNVDYNNQRSIINCRVPQSATCDVNTWDSKIRSLYRIWIRRLVDAFNHVEKDFWLGFISEAGVYSLGEVFDGSPGLVACYVRAPLDIVFHLRHLLLAQRVLTAERLVTGHCRPAQLGREHVSGSCRAGNLSGQPRQRALLNQKNDAALLDNTLTYVMLARGVPIVYYGTEQAYDGGAHIYSLEDLWRTVFNTKSELRGDEDMVALTSSIETSAEGSLGNPASGCGGSRRLVEKGIFAGKTCKADDRGMLCVDVNIGEPGVLCA
ncbi:hypothetical protein E4U53_005667 [Claviceps sorghi]|nr:hypothetical protein E4U53_005667 [Claviceps sorghi]